MIAEPTTPKPITAQPFRPLPDNAALQRLKNLPNWVCWDYQWNAQRGDWGKVPINPRTGNSAQSNNRSTWGTYAEAERLALAKGLAGVGYMMSPDDDLEGGDLDDCRDPQSGALVGWAQEVLRLAETYCEASPSGTGIRMFFDGKKDKALKYDPAGVELYNGGRYLTLTGIHIPGTPEAITASPGMRAAIVARVETMRAAAAAEKQAAQPPLSQRATPARPALGHNSRNGPDFFRNVNNLALANLSRWVPAMFGAAATFQVGTSGYRISSRALGRNLEEDLSITPMGISDWGVHDMGDSRDGKRTAIDLVIEYGGASDATAAAGWLCDHLGADPETLGWRNGRADDAPQQHQPEPEKPSAKMNGAAGPKHALYQGIPTPLLRDRLRIAQALDAPEPFPTERLPAVLRNAIAALVEHVQAPEALCAHSILGAAALVAQAHANVYVPALPESRPLSLFLLVLAASGERKSACDAIALHALEQVEAELRITYAEQKEAYGAAKQAYDSERKKIASDRKMELEDRKRAFADLREPEEPLWPHMRVKEPTFEGLTKLLQHGRGSVGLFTSEGGQFIGGHGMTDDAKVRTITGLSELWDNGSAQRVRANEVTYINGRRVSISLAVQPRLAVSLLGDATARDQGFLGRFLLMMPDSTIGKRIIRISEPMKDPRIMAFHRQCRQLLDRQFPVVDMTRNELAPADICLSNDAWAIWQAIAQEIEDQCKPDGIWAPIRSAALKMAENIARIAGVLAVFEDPSILDVGWRGEVSGEIMGIACEIGGFYLLEARRLIGHKALDPALNESDELARWLVEKWPHDLVSPRLIQQSAPNHLRGTAEDVREKIRTLQDAGVLDLVGAGMIDGKNYRETYRINRGDAG